MADDVDSVLLPMQQSSNVLTDDDGPGNDRERFRRRMIDRILTSLEDPKSHMGHENIDRLFDKPQEIDSDLVRLT